LVAHICRRLDGIPLAIELAAARIKLMTVEQIAAHLDDALHLLRGRNRSGPPRHQTLQAAIDWSYQLLSAGERILFRRLSVFAGGFTLEEAEEVASGMGQGARGSESWTNDLPRADVLDLLSQLIDQSLVMVAQHEHAVEARYRLLETIRQYAKAKLQASGEMAAVRQQHADFFVRMAEATWQTYKGREEVKWIEQMEREHDNFRTALEWAVEEKQSALGLRLAGAIWRFWYVRGYLSESRDWLTRLMALPDVSIYTPEYAAASYGAGVIAWRQGDHTEARALGERALQLYRILEDGEGIGLCLIGLANVIGAGGDYQSQRTYLEEGLALFRELDDKSGVAGALNNLGELARLEGDFGGAEPYYAECLALYQSLGNSDGTALVQHNLGQVALHEGDNARAATLFRDSLSAYNALGHRSGIAMCLEAVAGLAAAQGQAMQAARLSGAAEGLRKAIGVTMDGADLTAHDLYLARARERLTEAEFAAACAAGRTMPPEQAVAEGQALMQST
jgi:tetratricopeptide (TPR) repeat protein